MSYEDERFLSPSAASISCLNGMNINKLISSLKRLLEEVQIHVANQSENQNEELCALRLFVLDPVSFPLTEPTILAERQRREDIRLLEESHMQRLEAIVAAISIHIEHPLILTGDRSVFPNQ
eukprot:scaffold10465_cov30-Attheya_sp.AAC.2